MGHNSIMSASRMNTAIVIFLNSGDKVNKIVTSGAVIQDFFTTALPLRTLVKKDNTVQCVLPFIKDEAIIKELSDNSKLIPLIKKKKSHKAVNRCW